MKKPTLEPLRMVRRKDEGASPDPPEKTQGAHPKYEAPDGGYGWIIVLGASIVMVSTRSAEPSFGLLFGDFLSDLGVETTGAAVIMNTMDAVMNFSGLMVAPLIRTYSYRKVSIIGSVLCTLSILLTVPAKSFIHIVLTFSVIGGIGAGLAISATFVAINTFFTKRKGMAVGFSMAGTGVGLLLMPTTIRLLLDNFGFRVAVLLLAGFTMHSIAGSLLLRPIKWYRVEVTRTVVQPTIQVEDVEDPKSAKTPPPTPLELSAEKNAESPLSNVESGGHFGKNGRPLFHIGEHKMNSTTIVMEEEDKHFCADGKPDRSLIPRNFSMDAMHGGPWKSLLLTASGGAAGSMDVERAPRKSSYNLESTRFRRNESIVASSVDLSGSTFHLPGSLLALESPERTRKKSECHAAHHLEKDDVLLEKEELEETEEGSEADGEEAEEGQGRPGALCLSRFVRLMDLDLLRDPKFINILVGMSFFWVAEVNYRMVLPFFLSSLSYSKSETATVLTFIAATDILSRVVIPPVIDRVKVSRRTVFYVTSILLAIVRSAMAEMTSWVPLLSCAIVGGFLRGTTLINFQLTIAESCSLDKLPAAYGLSMVFKGIFIVALGPLIGVIRDATGSYPLCLHVQTLLILVCFLAWSVEFVGTWWGRHGRTKMMGG